MRRPEPSDHYGPMTEAELKAKVVALAHAAGWRVFSLPMVRNVRPVKGAEGYPDLTLARHGRVMWIELKAEDGNLSSEQMQWMRDLPYLNVVRPSDLGELVRVLA